MFSASLLKMDTKSSLALENGLDLRKVFTTGSVIQINADYNEADYYVESERAETKVVDAIGQPVNSFEDLEKQMTSVDPLGLVKKKLLEEGGGLKLHKGCTVHIVFSGYWENDPEPFDVMKPLKPLIVDLNDNGLLPGLQMAVESMLVGEMSVFLLSYKVMYGELGIPPRIKPKADCVFYIKLAKSILTPKEGKVQLSEPNMFQRVYHDVKLLLGSGVTLYKSKNVLTAIQLFRKAIFMLHNCRLADENEEKIQEKMLIKLYINLAVCHNLNKQPLKACIACNELNRLNSLWNNGKVLLQNAKALRMIGQYDAAEKKLRRAKKLCPDRKEIDTEFELLDKTRKACDQTTLIKREVGPSIELVSDDFKKEVDNLIRNFKENDDLCKLTLPGGLNTTELDYVKDACIRENLFFNRIRKEYALDKDKMSSSSKNEDSLDDNVSIDKNDDDGNDTDQTEIL